MSHEALGRGDTRIVETGRVTGRGRGLIEVTIHANEACARCGMCRKSTDDSMVIDVRDDPAIEVGQPVRVTFPYRSTWAAIFYVFVLPLALFFSFGLAASVAAARAEVSGVAGNAAAMLAALAGLLVGVAIARLADRRFHRRLVDETRIEPLAEPGRLS